MLREGVAACLRHNDVIEDPDIEQSQAGLESFRNTTIRGAGLSHPAGVVVPENHRRCVELQRAPGDFPGVDRRAVDRAVEHILGGDDLVLVVQVDHRKHLTFLGANPQPQILRGFAGTGECIAIGPAVFLQKADRGFDHCLLRGILQSLHFFAP